MRSTIASSKPPDAAGDAARQRHRRRFDVRRRDVAGELRDRRGRRKRAGSAQPQAGRKNPGGTREPRRQAAFAGTVAAAIRGRLIGDARMEAAIGQPFDGVPPQKKKSAAPGSPIGQRHLLSFNSRSEQRCPIGMMFSISSAAGSSGFRKTSSGASAVCRAPGRASRICAVGARGLRWPGPRRRAFGAAGQARAMDLADHGITGTPPSSAAIWLAERPSAHSFLSNSTRSSVHVMAHPLSLSRFLRPAESLLRRRSTREPSAVDAYSDLGLHTSTAARDVVSVTR